MVNKRPYNHPLEVILDKGIKLNKDTGFLKSGIIDSLLKTDTLKTEAYLKKYMPEILEITLEKYNDDETAKKYIMKTIHEYNTMGQVTITGKSDNAIILICSTNLS